jgi:hypothetical protein
MLAGGLLLPKLHGLTAPQPARTSVRRAPRVAGASFQFPRRDGAAAPAASAAPSISSADLLASTVGQPRKLTLGRAARHVFDVGSWTPILGALPAAPGTTNAPAPFLIGVAGTLR